MFVKPYAVAVGPDGRVYVTDTAARRVFVVDREHGAISFIGDRGNVSLTKPVGIAIDELSDEQRRYLGSWSEGT